MTLFFNNKLTFGKYSLMSQLFNFWTFNFATFLSKVGLPCLLTELNRN
jgi:hypothetical protein